MGRKRKFPVPADCKGSTPAVMCSAGRVLGLYNQEFEPSAKRISKAVRTWFASEAAKVGWAGVHFVVDVQSGHCSGCVMWQPPTQVNVQITVTKETLVLIPNADAEDT